MREDHTLPEWRPSVDKLKSTLRKLKTLEKPDAVVHVIHDLAYQKLYREQPRPKEIFQLIMMLHHLWEMSLGVNKVSHRVADELMIQTAKAEQLPQGPPAKAVDPEKARSRIAEFVEAFRVMNGRNDHIHGIYINPMSEPAILRASDLEMLVMETRHLNPPEATDTVTEAIGQYLNEQKQGAEQLIAQHVYAQGRCTCGRSMDSGEWAKHVRIRVWNYLKNEFKTDAQAT
jgi:hypothetical protein